MLAYYAHCTSLYNTPQEARDIALIEELGFTLYNPNCKEADIAYEKHGMPWFKKKVEECDCLVFRSLPDRHIPAGVYKEIQWAKERDRPVFELPTGILKRELSVEKTREYLREVGQR